MQLLSGPPAVTVLPPLITHISWRCYTEPDANLLEGLQTSLAVNWFTTCIR